MGLPGRPSLARILLLSVVLSGLALGPQAASAGAASAGAVDNRRTPSPGSATLPVRGPRQRLGWTGRTAAGAWLRARFTYMIEATDAAGNTARSGRHSVRVL
jgi:hypothetical protein